MNIKQLIDALERMPKDADLWLENEEATLTGEITGLKLRIFEDDNPDVIILSDNYGLCLDEED